MVLYSFKWSCLNTNSLVRTAGSSNNLYYCPLLNYLKNAKEMFLCLSDTRLSDEKFAFLEERLCLSSSYNIKTMRLFSTNSGTNKRPRAGCCIFFPQSVDGQISQVLEVIRDDDIQEPRFIILVVRFCNGPPCLIAAIYAKTNGSVQTKAAFLNRVNRTVCEAIDRHTVKFSFIGGDVNLDADSPSESLVKHAFKNLMASTDVSDAFRDINGSAAHNKGNTFFDRSKSAKNGSRLDYLCCSTAILDNAVKKSIYLTDFSPQKCDHLMVSCHLTWTIAGDPLNLKLNEREFKCDTSLLSNELFLAEAKSLLKKVLIKSCPHNIANGGIIPAADLLGYDILSIQDTFDEKCFGEFDYVGLFYQLIDTFAMHQESFSKREFNHSRSQKNVNNKALASLLKAPSSRTNRRLIANIREKLYQLGIEDIKKQAERAFIDYHFLGESATRYFLRSKLIRRRKNKIRSLEINDEEVTESSQIEDEFQKVYSKILQEKDPFTDSQFQEFIEPIKQSFPRISDDMKRKLDSKVSMTELILTFKQMRSASAGGPDGVNNPLFAFFLDSVCPKIILHAINEQIHLGKSADNQNLMKRRIIFIPKSDSEKKGIGKFRPISLLNIAIKVSDSIMYKRIATALESEEIFPSYMTAYRKAYSPTDTLLSSLCALDISNHNMTPLTLVSTDLSQAFDKISRKLITAVMSEMNFPDSIMQKTLALHAGALAEIAVNDNLSRNSSVQVLSGTPQGSPSSGLLFTIATLPLYLKLNSKNYLNAFPFDIIPKSNIFNSSELTRAGTGLEGFKHPPAVAYSDDGLCHLKGGDISDILKLSKTFEQFGNFSNLSVNRSKSRITTVNYKLTEDQILILEREGYTRQMVSGDSFRFLGFIFNTSNRHFGLQEALDKQCVKITNILQSYNRCKTLTLRGRLAIVNSLVASRLPSFTNASFLRPKFFKKLQSIILRFSTRKNITAGSFNILSTRDGGIKIPELELRHKTARVVLLRKAAKLSIKVEKPDVHLWIKLLVHALGQFNFTSLSALLKSGELDLKLAIKFLRSVGLVSLQSLLENFLEYKTSINHDGLHGVKKPKTRKNRKKVCTCLSLPSSLTSPRCPHVSAVRPNDLPDPPRVLRDAMTPRRDTWPTSPLFGCHLNPKLTSRNNKSISELINTVIPQDELSCRNYRMIKFFDANLTAILPWTKISNGFISGINLDISEALDDEQSAIACKNFCVEIVNFCSSLGWLTDFEKCRYPAPDPLSQWVLNPSHSSPAPLLRKRLKSRFGDSYLTAVNKLAKNSGLQSVTKCRIIESIKQVCHNSISSVQTRRASLELAYGAMFYQKHLVKIPEYGASVPCGVCRTYEVSDAQPGWFNAMTHVWTLCAQSRFVFALAQSMSPRVTGCNIKIDPAMIYLSEVNESCKNTFKKNKSLRTAWNSILGVARATVVSLYYYKQKHKYLEERSIVNMFNRHLDAVRIIARLRGSRTDMQNIPIHFLNNPFRRTYSWFVKQALEDAADERTFRDTVSTPVTESVHTISIASKPTRQLYTTARMLVAVEQVLHELKGLNDLDDFCIKQDQICISNTTHKTSSKLDFLTFE